jgi:phage terminase large subunit-like protein
MATFPERAQRYATAVVAGDVVAGKWEKAACQRFLDDLVNQHSDWPYRFDDEAASRICEFAELMPHVEGEWGKPVWINGFKQYQKIILEDWQIFILANLFGWLEKKSGLRRFRRAYEEVARKNAKSTIAAIIALYMLACDGEAGAQVYSFATKKDQAKIVWKTARAMLQREPDFGELGLTENTSAIYNIETNSEFKPLARDSGSLDGLNTHCFIGDELHAQKDRGLYDVVDSSTGARSQALGFGITTAGSDRGGICYEQRTYACKVLNSTLRKHDGLGYKIAGDSAVDETFFCIIFTIDDGDDWHDEAFWRKANPNLGVSVKLDDMRAACRKAKSMMSAQPEFLTKRLNIWVNADSAWMDMRAWDRCGDSALRVDDFAGQECIASHDLASKVDIAAKMKLFWRDIDGVRHYYGFGSYYLNQRAIEEGSNSQYIGWAMGGQLTATPGDVTDFGIIEDELIADAKRFEIIEAPYDPFQATQFSQRMVAEGLPMIEIGATVKNFSEPMKWLEALVLQNRFHHDGSPVLSWMVSNTVCHRDAKENIFPRKEREENKIDGLVALLMCLNRALLTHEQDGNLDDFLNAPISA